ncbi:helix-turn-helix domain-containing protein [Ralstonia sp. 3N]|uniref:helix-turn-helix domain-containing protein n=1 Tax=Ralstonia sp. 3N TaxID=2675750 RepID=UPI0015588174|nr:helix-turn-helix transcriptional regulator [Ralstonia sp. 3N]NPT52362.1 helix-turn-helix domain-containing protein [Ralstonia sp. 3N]
MKYEELITKALAGFRSENEAAKAMGIKQPTLNRYAKGKTLPDFINTLRLAKQAKVSANEALDAVAIETAKREGALELVKQFFRKPLNASNRGRFSKA